jgi:hypothetical protein
MNINKAVDKAYESKSLKEIADAPVSALQGVSEGDAQLLEQAFKVRTVRDLAGLNTSNGHRPLWLWLKQKTEN